MATSKSPIRVLRASANKTARHLLAAERGELSIFDPLGKLAAARSRDVFKFGIVMDDKTLIIELSWELIRKSGEVALTEMIFKHMRGDQQTTH